MSLPRSSISAIKSNLSSAISAKDPLAIATAVDLPTFVKSAIVAAVPSHPPPPPPHAEYLKINGADWSNVLNPLLDAHLAIQMVSVYCVDCNIQKYVIPGNHNISHAPFPLTREHISRMIHVKYMKPNPLFTPLSIMPWDPRRETGSSRHCTSCAGIHIEQRRWRTVNKMRKIRTIMHGYRVP